MRLSLAPVLAPLLLFACATEPSDTGEGEGSEATSSEATNSGDGDGDASTGETDTADTAPTADTSEGDGDGDDGELPMPAQLPTPTGSCPSFASGNVVFEPEGIEPRTVKLWVGDNPDPGGLLVIYWHAYGSAPDEAAYTLSAPIIEAITAAGGIVAAPYSAPDSGEFPWYVVSGSDRQDDMMLGDEIVACALASTEVDPRRIHATGMSAGGLQTSAFSMARSRYIASVTSFSGGVYAPLDFDDPDNHFAAMIIHGGDNDIFGGFVNFKDLSTIWFNQLRDNGHFTFMCDHGGGHTIPANYGADVVNFLFQHPYGTEPSPYAAGLPAELPSDCVLQ